MKEDIEIKTATIKTGDIVLSAFNVLDKEPFNSAPTMLKLLVPIIAMDIEKDLGLVDTKEE